MRTWKLLASSGVGLLSWLLSNSQETITHPKMCLYWRSNTGTSTSLKSKSTRIMASNQDALWDMRK